jgi:hypothetical protein
MNDKQIMLIEDNAERDGAVESNWILCVPFIGSVITFEQQCVETLAETRIEILPSARGYTKLLISG